MEMSAQINELAGALAKAQAQMEGAKKDGHNPHFRSSYSTLASVWEACREPLTKNGLSVLQGASATGCDVTITTMLLHTSGQWVRETLMMVGKDHNPQSVGSIISYGRRYQLAAMVGIAPEDDDAEAGEGRAVSSQQAARLAPQRPQLPNANQSRNLTQPQRTDAVAKPPNTMTGTQPRPKLPEPTAQGKPVDVDTIPF